MIQAYDGDHLDEDFRTLEELNGSNAHTDQLRAFLDHVSEVEDLLWKLTKWNDVNGNHPKFNCKAINCFHRRGYYVYRIRFFFGELSRYRVLYVYDGRNDEVHYLAVVRKKDETLTVEENREEDYNYESEHPISARIIDEYERTGFSRGRSS